MCAQSAGARAPLGAVWRAAGSRQRNTAATTDRSGRPSWSCVLRLTYVTAYFMPADAGMLARASTETRATPAALPDQANVADSGMEMSAYTHSFNAVSTVAAMPAGVNAPGV